MQEVSVREPEERSSPGHWLVIGGVLWMLQGIAGIVKGTSYIQSANYWITTGASTWGWMHLVGGIIGVAAGFGIFSGAGWARWLGIFIAAMSIFVNFTFIPFEPWWALTIIFIDLWVIHALFVIDAYTTELMSAENRGRQRRRAYVFDPARPGRPRIDLTDRGRRRRQPEPVRR